jgi:hypothetical protein
MAEIPTAEKFLIINDDKDFKLSMSGRNVSEMMIAFAKLHVEAALKEASEKADTIYVEEDGCATGDYYEVDKDSILNSYPLTNIK